MTLLRLYNITCALISVTEMVMVVMMMVITLRKKRSWHKDTQRITMLSSSKLVMACSAQVAVRLKVLQFEH